MLKAKKPFLVGALVILLGAAATVAATAAAGASSPTAASSKATSSSRGKAHGRRVIVASPVAKVAPANQNPFFSVPTALLEGPAFGPNGNLYFLDFTAQAGKPKILQLDLRSKKTTPVYTDSTSIFSSLQFSPHDGKIYVTDFTGKIDALNPDGTGFHTVFSGPVQGRSVVPDDIAFNPAGDMYVADFQGTPWNPIGRVIRFDADGQNPVVLQGGLSQPNGISFTPDFSGLWVSEYSLGREDHLALSADGASITGGSVGMTANLGQSGGFDSNSVDSAGNVYQCVPRLGKVLVWNQDGDLVKTIVLPRNVPTTENLVTNLAIKPGTTDGYITVGGPDGGFIYSFRALAPGIPQSNGGGA